MKDSWRFSLKVICADRSQVMHALCVRPALIYAQDTAHWLMHTLQKVQGGGEKGEVENEEEEEWCKKKIGNNDAAQSAPTRSREEM